MIEKRLFKLAAEMALHKNMPSKELEEWTMPKGLQITAWRKVWDAADKAEEQCRLWAIELSDIARELTKKGE